MPVRFDRFMEEALYHPERGYYESLTSLGREGDFYTAPAFHPLFAWTLARWVTPFLERFREPVVVEGGAGLGDLADHALDYWRREHPALYQRLRYVIVERSAHLRALQEERLQSHPPVRWEEVPPPYRGVFWANELLDALPVRVFRRGVSGAEADWEELFVDPGPPPREVWRPVTAPPEMLARVPHATRRVELAPGLEAVLETLLRPMEEGVGILVDYGEEETALWTRYVEGTLQGYRGHRVVDPLERPGHTDITAFVNFSEVQRVLRRMGFALLPLMTQERFLFRAAIHEALEVFLKQHPDEAMRARLALKTLLLNFPTYRVQVFARGIEVGAACGS